MAMLLLFASFLVAYFLSPNVTAEEQLDIEESNYKHEFLFGQVENTFDEEVALESRKYRAKFAESISGMRKASNELCQLWPAPFTDGNDC
ncbi:Hypothetical predicted protein [Cloeon dipterum]|uniref:Uncharacterized protein n=1 Tax=Cloeon dipterum TaxID=197152 RepID=A0A8S1DGX8_9INSE|nr:Hypothetical predicted protein [Cloeon dipterum]